MLDHTNCVQALSNVHMPEDASSRTIKGNPLKPCKYGAYRPEKPFAQPEMNTTLSLHESLPGAYCKPIHHMA